LSRIQVLYLSELMLEWGENGQDIQQEIKELNETAIFTNAMLKAYDIYKDELFGRPAHSCSCQPKCNVRDIDEKKWEIYRDVMHAATQGKFLLVKEEEVGRLEQGTIICRAGIRSRSDIPKCRELAKQAFEALGVGPLALVSWLLAVSEAVTNVIKHAEWGEMSLIQDKASKELRLIVKDQGPGFPMKELPKMVLLSGYSTKKSLGQGFTLIMRIAQKVFLSTSSQGSVLVLVFYAEEGANVNGLLKDDAKNDHRRQVD
ncbi:ATP-binding protein, partial [Geobacillus thermoleovorans]|uniref:ATP-binding protein n=1 Tax=Geobacillus thermoleovorans TaxID=33941 RepID=UPI003D195CFA